MQEKKKEEEKIKIFKEDDKKLELKFLIYVLKLKDDRIYVGRTTQKGYDERLELHKKGKASAWTRKYRFISEMRDWYIKNASPFDQDRRVKQLMYLYGPNMVRGGTYSKTQSLTPEQEQFILKQMRGANDQCLYCGDPLHFINDCKKHKQHLQRRRLNPRRREQQQSMDFESYSQEYYGEDQIQNPSQQDSRSDSAQDDQQRHSERQQQDIHSEDNDDSHQEQEGQQYSQHSYSENYSFDDNS